VPQGTFNYSSRAHGIPLETIGATKALLEAQIKPVQVGVINDRIFLVNASLGLYPQLLQDREEYKKQYGRRRSVALWAGISTLLSYRGQLTLELEHDRKKEITRTPTLFVGNNQMQLERLGLPESEDVQQRRLAAVIVKPVSPMTLVWLALRGAIGQLGDEERVRDFAFHRMVVNPMQGGRRRHAQIKVATDGEVTWMRPPLTFSVAAQPLRLLVPSAPNAA
jgi:diacylglycerol kinase family enzyme